MQAYIQNLGKVRPTSEGVHDSTKEYDILCIVTNEDKTAAYISKKDVPVDISLDNEEYWECILKGSKIETSGLVDEEDLTSITVGENKVIKFKDRISNNGYGYIIIRKDKSVHEQMIQTKTIYEIRYDVDLNGETLNIPESCILKFNGGSLSNGIIIGDKTIIDSTPKEIFKETLVLGGTFLGYGYVEYYGCYPNDADNDVCFAINKLYNGFKHIQLECGTYYTNTGKIPVTSIRGRSKNTTHIIYYATANGDYLFSLGNMSDLNGSSRARYLEIGDLRITMTGEKASYQLNNCSGLKIGNIGDSSIHDMVVDLFQTNLKYTSTIILSQAIDDTTGSIEDNFNAAIRFTGYAECSELKNLRLLGTICIKGDSTSSTIDAISIENVQMIGGGAGYANSLYKCSIHNINYKGWSSWNQFVYGLKCTKTVQGLYIDGVRTEQPLKVVNEIGRQLATSIYIDNGDNNIRMSIQNCHIAGEANGIYLNALQIDVVMSNIFTYTNATGASSNYHLLYALKIGRTDALGMITTNNVILPYSDVQLSDWGIIENSVINFYGTEFYSIHSIRNAIITPKSTRNVPRKGLKPYATNNILKKYVKSGLIKANATIKYFKINDLAPAYWTFGIHTARCKGTYVFKDSEGTVMGSNEFEIIITKDSNFSFITRNSIDNVFKVRSKDEGDIGSQYKVVLVNYPDSPTNGIAFQNTHVDYDLEGYFEITMYSSNYGSLTQEVGWIDN